MEEENAPKNWVTLRNDISVDVLLFCFPVSKQEITTFEEVRERIDTLTVSDISWLTVAFWPFLSLFQNNEHHQEGWLYNHIILMLEALRQHPLYAELSIAETEILEQTIIWSDLGKKDTYKLSPKKTWPDGTPQATAFGHDKKSAEMYDAHFEGNAGEVHQLIRYLIMEHMNAHQLEKMDAEGKTTIPEFLQPQINGEIPGLWPTWDALDIPHGESLSKKGYAWIQRSASQLLRIKQDCDEQGRISVLSFS